MTRELKVSLFSVGLLILASLMYVWPFLRFPAFNLIDDGFNLQKVMVLRQNLSYQGWASNLYEVEIGRFRPGYFMYFFVVSIFGMTPGVFWIGQWVTLLTLLLAVWWLISVTTRSKWLGLIGSNVLLVLPALAENTFRLGTAELRQSVLVVALMVWLLDSKWSKNIWYFFFGGGVFIAALLTKETSLFLLPTIMLGLGLEIWQIPTQWKKYLLACLVYIVLAGLFVTGLPPRTGYASSYVFNFETIIKNIFIVRIAIPQLLWIGASMGASFLFRSLYVFTSWKKWLSESKSHLVIGSVLALSVAIQLPWQYQFERYYLIPYVAIVLFAMVEVNALIEYAKNVRLFQSTWFDVLKVYLVVTVISLALSTVFIGTEALKFNHVLKRSIASFESWYSQYHYSYAVIQNVSNLPENAHLYITHNDYEVIYEIGLFASHFGKKNIRIVSENAQTQSDFGDPYHLVDDVYSSFVSDEHSTGKTYLLTRGSVPASISASLSHELWPIPPGVKHESSFVWRLWQ